MSYDAFFRMIAAAAHGVTDDALLAGAATTEKAIEAEMDASQIQHGPTDNLRKSIGHNETQLSHGLGSVEVGVDIERAPYAKYLEEGTPDQIVPKTALGWLFSGRLFDWQEQHGVPVGPVKKVHGIKPMPFIGPLEVRHKPHIQDAMATAFLDGMQKIWR